jgi:hypothetical protein
MSNNLHLKIRLLSDATFGRGDGVAGLLDEEVEYDESTGLPFIRGRVLKGLLTEECANVMYALPEAQREMFAPAAADLFGNPGSKAKQSRLNVGDAELPEQLVEAVAASLRAKTITTSAVLESLTALRRQTAIDEESGAPEKGSLRTMRVVLRGTVFIAPLTIDGSLDVPHQALLAACVLGLRRGGTGRNRGRGRLGVRLIQKTGNTAQDVTDDFFAKFKTQLGVN